MPLEIERKFLVTGDAWKHHEAEYICQGYLNRDKSRTVRVRVSGETACLTIKGMTVGIVREEYEYAVPVEEARSMLKLCDGPLIEKYRRKIAYAGLVWEVDEFLGENAGLIVAEVELDYAEQVVSKPDWVGEEVTDDRRYFNSCLSATPYSTWC